MGDVEKDNTGNRKFFISGKELGRLLDDEKTKKLTLKLIQLLQGNDRTTLLEEMMRVLVMNQVEIPGFMSEMIMKGSDDDLHLGVGSFIEGLNSKAKEKSNKPMEEENGAY